MSKSWTASTYGLASAGFHKTHSILASPDHLSTMQALWFQFLWKTIFCFRAQRLWETIRNNFFSSVKTHGNPPLKMFSYTHFLALEAMNQ